MAIAHAAGNGPTAAGLGAAALGALRAARRDGSDLQEALSLMHQTVKKLDNDSFYVTALIARWQAATARLRWVNCGHPCAYLVDLDGNLSELESPVYPPLGTGDQDPSHEPTERRLNPGERIILITDGITGRHVEGGGTFGVDGLRRARESAAAATAASTAMAIQHAVTDCWREPLEDDGTVVVMAIT